MNSSNWRALARNVYHRLPLSQRAKWRLRERVLPFFLSVQQTPNLVGVLNGLRNAFKGVKTNSSLNRDNGRERALSSILLKLSVHAQQFGPPAYWIALPFLAPGGAESVAINLMRAIREVDPLRSVVLLVTDRGILSGAPELPEGVALIEFDKYLHDDLSHGRKQALLRDLLISSKPHLLHNINSEVAWKLIVAEGSRLKNYTQLYASIFAFQFGPDLKTKIGYAAYFLQDSIGHLTGLISDNHRFIRDAAVEYQFDDITQRKMRVLYQPSRLLYPNIEVSQLSQGRRLDLLGALRPKILWGWTARCRKAGRPLSRNCQGL